MKIGIIGQGASGTILAIMLKRDYPDLDITVFDHNDKTNKKLLATGNGRCNLGNLDLNFNSYNNEFAKNTVKQFNIIKQREFFDSIGIATRTLGNLVYPFSLSSNQVVSYLNKYMKELKIRLINDAYPSYYKASENDVEVSLKNKVYKFDKLVFATGGKSTPNLGSTGDLFKMFKEHKYKIVDLKPGLAPVEVVENVKGIENERLKGKVSLYIDKDKKYEEEGEVLIKKNGLSGISIFNCNSIINRNKKGKKTRIVIDLFPELTVEQLVSKFDKYTDLTGFSFLEGVFSIKMAEFIRKNSRAKNLLKFDSRDIKNIAEYCKNVEFTYKNSYGFDNSQVTLGGISLDNLNEDFSSKIEPNVYMIGEMVDVDGLCGGYNLMFAFASAKQVYNSISKLFK